MTTKKPPTHNPKQFDEVIIDEHFITEAGEIVKEMHNLLRQYDARSCVIATMVCHVTAIISARDKVVGKDVSEEDLVQMIHSAVRQIFVFSEEKICHEPPKTLQ